MERVRKKILYELFRLLHPQLWNKSLQINGIPEIAYISGLKIGTNVSINSGCFFQGYGGITIGNNVTISRGVSILTRTLDVQHYTINAKKKYRDHIDEAVIISDGVWLAANVIILPGVVIAKNCVVAAGAVVAKSLQEENTLYAGVPAKKVKRLDEK